MVINMIPEQYNILWTGSMIIMYPTIISLYNKKYDLSIATGTVFITSLIYWRKPENNWKQVFDKTAVKLCFLYQIYVAYLENKLLGYTIINSISIGSYYYGIYYYYLKEKYWEYTYCHLILHLFSNLANIYLSIND